MEIKTQLIEAEQTYPLRQKVLRPGKPLESCYFPEDQNPLGFHVGAFHQELLVGIASFHPEANPLFHAKNMFRLRGMAADSSLQNSGIGKKLLLFAFQELQKRNCDLLWCNARQIAYPFYEKLGFKYNSEEFDIPGVGPHKIMSLPMTKI